MAVLQPPAENQLVTVRQRRYVVSGVRPSQLEPDPLRPLALLQHQVTLQCVEDDAMGEELEVIWEIEPGTRVHEALQLPAPTGFDQPRTLDAFLNAVRWGAISTADTSAIQAPFRSGIVIEPYQLDPLVRALQMPRVSLLIADDVGLGKTIEAGLVVQEMLLRHRAHRIMVVCPSGLQLQWRDQMRDKFGLEFRIVDSSLFRELRRKRGLHVNPWTHFPRLITSVDFIKRDRPMRLLREVLPREGEPRYPRAFDMLIVDEAHGIAPSRSGGYASDSLRTQAIRALAPHCEHKLFLTATPHNGYSPSFTALLEILDNQRFARGVPPAREQLGAVMVRRMKTEILGFDNKPRFPTRDLQHIEVEYTQEERDVHRMLAEYTRLRTHDPRDAAERFATEFVLKTLKKRLFSSPAAFARTLEQHERTLQEARKRQASAAAFQRPTLGRVQQQVMRLDEEFGNDDDFDETAEEAVETTSRLFREVTPAERELLRTMHAWAERAERRVDAKAARLMKWLKTHIKCGPPIPGQGAGASWSDRRVIIFTEYRATQKWLQERLASEGLADAERLMVMYGGMDLDKREAIKAAFQADPAESPVRILLATDAASEGIDLQNHCARMIHYEIPWNPNRLEQRNGRIDRHGQKGYYDDQGHRVRAVIINHFVGAGFERRLSFTESPGDLEGDLEFLCRAALKVQTIREDLGKVGPVIAQQVEAAMLKGRGRLDTRVAELEAQAVRKTIQFERDIKQRIERLKKKLHSSKKALHLSARNVRNAVEVGLKVAGFGALIPCALPEANVSAKDRKAFRLPRLEGSWTQCLEGLAHPHTGKLRPITFHEEVARATDKVVHAHLNHRLVQQCLRLLRAQIWSPRGSSKLHRVSFRTVAGGRLDEPAVVVHARLVVTGGDSRRLHEELITTGGRLVEGKFLLIKSQPLLQEALSHASDQVPPEDIRERLAKMWPKHQRSLQRALKVRRQKRFDKLGKILKARGEKESRDIETILQELAEAIRREITVPQMLRMDQEPEVEQLEFGFVEELDRAAAEQLLERDLHSLRARLEEIPAEIVREQKQVRKRFDRLECHLFPVAVTYLVPDKLCRE